MVYKQKNSNRWWYKFTWNGELIRESTKQANKRVAEQMEAAHKTALAKGEVGIRERMPGSQARGIRRERFRTLSRRAVRGKAQNCRVLPQRYEQTDRLRATRPDSARYRHE